MSDYRTPDSLEILQRFDEIEAQRGQSDKKRDGRGYLFVWIPLAGVSGRYRDKQTGRFVSSVTVRREIDIYLDTSDSTVRVLSELLRNRNISLADWELAMRREIKRTHLNAIAMQRGGWANMRPSDYGRAGQIIRGQYAYLRNFANQIADGTQRLDGTFIRRAEMYTQAGRNSFYQSAHANMKAGVTHVMSNRHARDSCIDCIELDGRWFVIGDPRYRLPGNRQCRVNCRCSETYGYMGDDGMVTAGTI